MRRLRDGNREIAWTGSLPGSILTACAVMAAPAIAAAPADEAPTTEAASLAATVTELDSAVFDAFNRCSAPEQLQKHAGYFAQDVEFYHDTGGVTWNRRDMIVNTGKNACGKYRRELLPGTLMVYPVKDFGAIEQGVHRFCEIDSDVCEGMADFVIIWRNAGGRWEITRVLSYGHRPGS